MAKTKKHWSDDINYLCCTWRRKLKKYDTEREAWDDLPYHVLRLILNDHYNISIDEKALKKLLIEQKKLLKKCNIKPKLNKSINYSILRNFDKYYTFIEYNIDILNNNYFSNTTTQKVFNSIDDMLALFIRRHIPSCSVKIVNENGRM